MKHIYKGKKDNKKMIRILGLSGKDFKATPKISITDVFRELQGIMFNNGMYDANML